MADEELHYREVEPITEEEAGRALASGEPVAIADALFRLALYSADAESVEELCLQYADSPDDELRRMAALSMATVARIHREAFDGRRAFAKLLSMLEDRISMVRGEAEEALSDLAIFRWHYRSYSHARMVPLLRSDEVFDRYCAIFHVARHDPDTTFAWESCRQCLSDAHYAVRARALWGIPGMWDRLDRRHKADATAQVSHLLTDSHWWVRETAQRVKESIAPDAGPDARPE